MHLTIKKKKPVSLFVQKMREMYHSIIAIARHNLD